MCVSQSPEGGAITARKSSSWRGAACALVLGWVSGAVGGCGGSPAGHEHGHDHVHAAHAPARDLAAHPAPRPQAESTRRMIERLHELDAKVDGASTMFFPHKAVRHYAPLMAAARTNQERLRLTLPYALSLMNDGQTEAAIEQLDSFERMIQRTGMTLEHDVIVAYLETKAVAYLRLGEQENCLHNHNADSCLFPIQGGGIHINPRGSRAAIEVLNELLEFAPSPYAIWLLNIAYMTLGEYPHGVPPQWRVPPEAFAAEHDIKRFPDVAGALGLDVDDVAGGVVMEDFDGDGWLDLLVSAWGFQGQMRYFRNNGDGTFSDLTEAAGLAGFVGGLNLVPGDYDNDGRVDVLVLRDGWLGKDGRFPNSLLRNHGDHYFSDVTEEAGLLSFHPTQTAAWFDYNGDGFLDLFIGNETVPGTPDVDACELYRNNGDGTFTECAALHGLAVTDWIKAVVSGDYNNDGRPDLYLSSLTGPNRLFRNDGPAQAGGGSDAPWRFTEVAREAGVTEPLKSFPCWFFDYDNDGWLDLFVSGYSIRNAGDILADYVGAAHQGERARLYRNRGDGTFEDVTRSAGLHRVVHTMGSNFGDLDSDGWLDFYAGTGDPSLGTLIPSRMFRNDAGRRFQEVTTSGGFGQLQKGHGIAFGDLNHDGGQDIYSVVGGAFSGDHYPNQLFANPGHGHRWLKLRLEGVDTNRIALGARIKVVVDTPRGEREIHRVVTSGGSFGASPLRQDIGLGDARRIVRVEIVWPRSGRTQVVTGLALDRAYDVREGAAQAEERTLGTFAWPVVPVGGGAPHRHH